MKVASIYLKISKRNPKIDIEMKVGKLFREEN